MLQIHLRSSLRILWRNRFTTIINVAGLAAGITSCLLIYMFVQNELSYDQHHHKKDRIYRIVSDLSLSGDDDHSGLSSFMLSPTLKNDYPEIEEAVRVMPVSKQTMWVDNKPFQFADNLMSEAAFFSIFDYDFIEGDPKTALEAPQSVVVTDEVAEKLFGTSTGVIGKMIQYARQSYKVTGVVKDVKNNSHLYFNTILSLNSITPQLENTLKNDWFYLMQTNYVLFKNESDAEGFEKKLLQLRDKYILPWLEQVNSKGKIVFHLQKLTDIHLTKEYPAGYTKTGNRSYIYIFSVVAVFILVIACINYVNLATATASKRAKETGIRKTCGASTGSLFRQFISESALTAFIAILFALCLVHILLPAFNHLTEKSLHVPYSFAMLGILAAMLVWIGLIAGAYPAFYLSRLQPADVLKSSRIPGGFPALLRKTLVVLQFFISVSFISCTLIVYSQMQYMKHADMGFDKDQVLVVTVPVADTSFVGKYEVVKHELSQHKDILKVAASSSIPGVRSGTLIHAVEMPDHQVQERAMDMMWVSHDFVDLMGMKIVSGRNFSRDFKTDDTAAFIVNEKAIEHYGWKNPFDYTVENGFGYKGKIIGVVKDFNYASLHQPIEPMVMMLDGRLQGYLLLKVRAGEEAGVISFVEGLWKQYSHKYPVEYFFLDDNFHKLYRKEEKMMQVFTYFSVISILISCLGLYALISFTLDQRTKEIGIRKVMGASVTHLIYITGKNFVILVTIAILLAVPVSWYFMQQWLQDFAHRIAITWLVFAMASFLALSVALLTLLFKTYRAATADPVKSLRYE